MDVRTRLGQDMGGFGTSAEDCDRGLFPSRLQELQTDGWLINANAKIKV